MDFDDQMIYAKRILETCPPVLDYFHERCRYICVDEAQDTSKIQHAIIRLLAQRSGNLFMVGDEDQSVYGFRAAWPDALMNFERDYPGARVLLMERNYRSTDEIIGAAKAFISGNRFRRRKDIAGVRGNGSPVQIVAAADRQAQFQYVLHASRECAEETAILYRNNDSAIPLIDLLERNGVPYNFKKSEDMFFTNRVVRDMSDIIRLALDPCDERAFMNIYYKFGVPISKQAAQQACRQSQKSGKPILEELASEAGGSVRNRLQSLLQTMPLISGDSAADALERVWTECRYRQYAKKSQLDANKYDILAMLAERETDAKGLLRRLDELKTLIQNHRNNPENGLILSTIHSSKGLEYDRVFLLDVFDGLLPSISREEVKTAADAKLYEEERRLFYVAMTRAKNELRLLSCDRSSAFIREMRGFLLKTADADETPCGRAVAETKTAPRSGVSRRTAEPPLSADELFCGMSVAHKSFGGGRVVSFDRKFLEVFFPKRNETKRFVLDFTLQNRLLKAL